MIYIVSGLHTKNTKTGINIQHALSTIAAESKEEAIGKYILEMCKKLPGYDLFQEPLLTSMAKAEKIVKNEAKGARKG